MAVTIANLIENHQFLAFYCGKCGTFGHCDPEQLDTPGELLISSLEPYFECPRCKHRNDDRDHLLKVLPYAH
jgi:predicted nucleic-acid-binding Zn-ribbon protein